jgi:O-antigen/teichoic acid export membrane protein
MTDPDLPASHQHAKVSTRTAIGSAWLIVSRFATKAIDFAALLVLARLLTPGDFGLVSVAMTFVLIVEAIFELPVAQILVRSQHLDKEHFDTAFTLSALRGFILMLVLAALSIPAAHFYNDQRVVPLMLMLSLAPATRGLLSPKMANNARRIFYRYDFYIEVAGKLAGFAAATTCAFATHSYWSIALGTVTTPIVMLLTSYVLAPYMPVLSLRKWRDFAGFLGWSSAAQVFSAINWQCDRLILARYTSKPTFGAFTMANDLSYLPEQAIIKPIQRPLLSAFALIRADKERLKAAYLRTVVALLLCGIPVMVCLSVLAKPIVLFALSAKWQPAIPILQIVSLTLIPPLFTSPLPPLAIALGRNDIFLRLNLIEFSFKIPAVAIGAIFFGLQGVLMARIASALVLAVVSMAYTRYLVGASYREQLSQIWHVVGAGLILGIYLYWCGPLLAGLSGLPLAVGLAAIGSTGLITFLAVVLFLWWVKGRPAGVEATAVHHGFNLLGRISKRYGAL